MVSKLTVDLDSMYAVIYSCILVYFSDSNTQYMMMIIIIMLSLYLSHRVDLRPMSLGLGPLGNDVAMVT